MSETFDKLLVCNGSIQFRKNNLKESLILNDDGIIECYKNNELVQRIPFSKTEVQKQCNRLMKEGFSIYTTSQYEDGSYTTQKYDTVESQEQAAEIVSELNAQGISASYENDDMPVYEDDDTFYVIINRNLVDQFLKYYPDEFTKNASKAISFKSRDEAQDFIDNYKYNDEEAPKDIDSWEPFPIYHPEDYLEESNNTNLPSTEDIDNQIDNTEQAIEKIDKLQTLQDELYTKFDNLVTESVDFPSSTISESPMNYETLMNSNIKDNLQDDQIQWIEVNIDTLDNTLNGFKDLLSLLDNNVDISLNDYIILMKSYLDNTNN